MTSRPSSSVIIPRLVLGTLVFTSVFFSSLYQPWLSAFWRYLYASSLYRLSCFETILTISCYAIIEPIYTYKFGHNPHLRIDVRGRDKRESNGDRPELPKMRRPSKRLGETLIYAAPLLLMDFIMVKKFAQVPLDDILSSAGYAPRQMARDVRNAAGIMNNSTISNSFLLPTLHNFSKGSPLQLGRALPPVPPTSRRLVGELCASFFIYDAMFFLAHLAVHRIKPLMRIHESHHSHTEIHPQITNQLSMIERLSLVLFANFSLNIIGAHVLTRSIFIPIFVYLLVEIHSGIDLPWSYDKLMPAGWGAGAKTHAYHHRTGKGAFAPFFGWWDAGLKWATSSPVEKSPRARR